jgi:hypothetical protein
MIEDRRSQSAIWVSARVLEYTTRGDYFPETDSPTTWRPEMPAIEGRLARKQGETSRDAFRFSMSDWTDMRFSFDRNVVWPVQI